jgi:Tfp pilus assembly protein PilN
MSAVKQQINLYPRERVAQRDGAKNTFPTLAIVGVLLAIGVYVGNEAWMINNMTQQLQQLTREYDGINQEIAARKAALLGGDYAPDGQTVEELKEQLAMKRRQLTAMQQHLGENSSGYSDYLLALARQHVKGMWLTQVEISGQADNLFVTGRSADPKLVPRYVSNLKQESILQGVQFQSFRIAQSRDNDSRTSYVEFAVTTDESSGSER